MLMLILILFTYIFWWMVSICILTAISQRNDPDSGYNDLVWTLLLAAFLTYFTWS